MDRKYPSIYTKASKVTKSDTDSSGNIFAGLILGHGGDVAVVMRDHATGTVTTFTNMQTGALLPIAVKYVMAAGTTASGIVGLN